MRKVLCTGSRACSRPGANYTLDKRVHFSLLFMGTVCISIGTNENAPHRNCWSGFRFSKHSEIDALERAEYALRKMRKGNRRASLIMVNLAFTSNRLLKISKPCVHCSRAIMQHPSAVLRTIYWSTNNGTFEKGTPAFCVQTGVPSQAEASIEDERMEDKVLRSSERVSPPRTRRASPQSVLERLRRSGLKKTH